MLPIKVTFLLVFLTATVSSLTEEDYDYNEIEDLSSRTTPPLDDLPTFFGRIVGPKTLMKGQWSRQISNWIIEVAGYLIGGNFLN